MVKGKTLVMVILAFFEALIWFIVAREALITNMKSIFIPISYSLGYASGTFIGSFISSHFIKGIIGVQVVVNKNKALMNQIRKHGYEASVVDLKDDFEGNKREMIFFQINKNSLKKLIALIKKYDDTAFIVVSETKAVQNGYIK